MSHATPSIRRFADRAGVTLLELIIVLALMGLVLAVAAPAFIVPKSEHESDLAAVLSSARHAAILRAEPVTLSIDDAGAWRIDGDASVAEPIATGTLGGPVGRVRVHVSPIGACVGEAASETAMDWDVADCRVARSSGGDTPR
jgi:prepilin-type N-terminal cleavage/methylation domain-containing protein